MSEKDSFSKEDIRFNFEEFLEDHEQNLPEGLDPVYLSYAQTLEHPMKNILKLRKAVVTLPVNALLHQTWGSILQFFLVLFILSLPATSIFIYTASLYSVNLAPNAINPTLIVGTMLFLMYVGFLASFAYLKLVHNLIRSTVESKKAPWLVEEIKDPFDKLYQSPWSRKVFRIALFVPILYEIKIILLLYQHSLSTGSFGIVNMILPVVLLLLGHVGMTLLIYFASISFLFVIRNTKIYDLLLVRIIERVKGYTEGHESILTKKNLDVISVLSDTPGLSIQSMGDIPQLGLLSSILTFNSALITIITPYLINGALADFIAARAPEAQYIKRQADYYTGFTYIILLGMIISSLAAFGAVIMPLFRISRVMGIFKRKALMELDPFIFDEIMIVALKRDALISNETLLLHMLRSYIHTMKISPVPPLRLIYLVAISMVYSLRIIPTIIGIFI